VIEVYGEENCGKGPPDSISWPVPSSSLDATETGCHLHDGHLTPQQQLLVEKTFPHTNWALKRNKQKYLMQLYYSNIINTLPAKKAILPLHFFFFSLQNHFFFEVRGVGAL